MSSANVVVVTGCTQGLGYYAVKTLAQDLTKGTQKYDCVVLCCRNVAAAKKAAETVARQTKCDPAKLVVLEEGCNLCEPRSVRAYAAALKAFLGERKIVSLVNNAGIGGNPAFHKTSQGLDMIWATNHLGHFLLTLLLLRHLAPDSRIMNVSSDVHDPANKTPLPDADQYWPQTTEEYDQRLARGDPFPGESIVTSGGRRYSRSKLCNVLFTNELARRLSGAVPYALPDAALDAWRSSRAAVCTLPAARTIQVVAMNPGLMLDSGFFSGVLGRFLGWLVWLLTPLLRITPARRFLRSAASSGVTLARLALPAPPSPTAVSTSAGALVAAPASKTGAVSAVFFDGDEVKPSSAFSRSPDAVARYQVELWEHSLRWAGVTPEELRDAGLA
mmetsp:Transcript_4670/g.14227  ORF Transcript_4670/g.14227 Transcript_4670/m.14227 type:complete len:388 (-) Transcript_4670:299-1462(-)